MKASRAGLFGIKVVVTAGLLWFLFDSVDLGPVANRFSAMKASWMIAAVAVLQAQLLLTGIRWTNVGRLVGVAIGTRQALRLVVIGQLFSQVLPSSIGGDGVRAWLISREGVPLRRAVVSIICDRLVALVVLTVLVAAALLLLRLSAGTQIPSIDTFAVTALALTLLGLLTLLLLGGRLSSLLMRSVVLRPVGVLIRDLRKVLFTSVQSLWIIALAFIVQGMVVLSVYFCARGLNVEMGIVHLLLLPPILLVSMVPISFAGWGVREGVMVVGLGFAGVTGAEALAISVAFGLAQVIVGMPGVIAILKGGLPKVKMDTELRGIAP